jgi:hypothetical protein
MHASCLIHNLYKEKYYSNFVWKLAKIILFEKKKKQLFRP